VKSKPCPKKLYRLRLADFEYDLIAAALDHYREGIGEAYETHKEALMLMVSEVEDELRLSKEMADAIHESVVRQKFPDRN
jgi:hypothetical protein